MNYGTLKADVAAYLHRSDLTSRIPDFIEHARRRLGRELRSLSNQAAGTATSFSAERTSLPANLAGLIGVWLDDVELTYLPPHLIGGRTGGVYSIDGGDLVVPGAGSTTSVDLSYWTIPAALVNDPDVSEGMNELPDVWRAAAVEEGAVFLQDWELAEQMNLRYLAGVRDANRQATDARFGAGVAIISDYPSIQGMASL